MKLILSLLVFLLAGTAFAEEVIVIRSEENLEEVTVREHIETGKVEFQNAVGDWTPTEIVVELAFWDSHQFPPPHYPHRGHENAYRDYYYQPQHPRHRCGQYYDYPCPNRRLYYNDRSFDYIEEKYQREEYIIRRYRRSY